MGSQHQICWVQVPAPTMSSKELAELSFHAIPVPPKYHAAETIAITPHTLASWPSQVWFPVQWGVVVRAILRPSRFLAAVATVSVRPNAYTSQYELLIRLGRFRVPAPLFCSRPRAWNVNAVIDCMKTRAELCPNPLVHSCIHTEKLS